MEAVEAGLSPDSQKGSANTDGTTEVVVSLEGVFHAFGDVAALTDLTLSVPKGTITVLLGPNGAGKTTALRVITGAIAPHRGNVRVFGLDPQIHGEDVRRRCGVVSAKPSLYDRLSGWENLYYAARLYGVHREAEARIRRAAEHFGIQYALDRQVGAYSTGMKTRLALARAILHDPELLLFDEPTSGLDPESSQAVLQLIRQMTSTGRSVVMCTHLLAEAEGLADHVVILDAGADLVQGSPEELIRRYWPHQVVRFESLDPGGLELLRDRPGVLSFGWDGSVDSTAAVVQVDTIERIPALIDELRGRGVRVVRVDPHRPTLEELYFAVRAERRMDATVAHPDAHRWGGPGQELATRARDAEEAATR